MFRRSGHILFTFEIPLISLHWRVEIQSEKFLVCVRVRLCVHNKHNVCGVVREEGRRYAKKSTIPKVIALRILRVTISNFAPTSDKKRERRIRSRQPTKNVYIQTNTMSCCDNAIDKHFINSMLVEMCVCLISLPPWAIYLSISLSFSAPLLLLKFRKISTNAFLFSAHSSRLHSFYSQQISTRTLYICINSMAKISF